MSDVLGYRMARSLRETSTDIRTVPKAEEVVEKLKRQRVLAAANEVSDSPVSLAAAPPPTAVIAFIGALARAIAALCPSKGAIDLPVAAMEH